MSTQNAERNPDASSIIADGRTDVGKDVSTSVITDGRTDGRYDLNRFGLPIDMGARNARYAETRAQGHTPCDRCGRRATKWVRSTSQRYSGPCCYWCMVAVSKIFYAAGVRDMMLDDVAGVVGVATAEHPEHAERTLTPEQTVIGGVDVPQLAREVLDGAVGDYPMLQVATLVGAAETTATVLESKIGRELDVTERAITYFHAANEFDLRRRRMRAALAETQVRLASPRRIFQ